MNYFHIWRYKISVWIKVSTCVKEKKYGKWHAGYDDYNSFINSMFYVLTTVNLVWFTLVVSLNVLQNLCFHYYFFLFFYGFEWWYFIMVFICLYPMINEIEHIFLCLCIFGELPSSDYCTFSIGLFVYIYYWVLNSSSILDTIILC